MIRVLLDANVWVSAFLSPDGHCGRLVRRLLGIRQVEIVMSAPILDETVDVLGRPRLTRRYRFGSEEVREYAAWIWAIAERIEPRAGTWGCRDPDDEMVCGTAVAGNVRYLVTRDDDLKRDPLLSGVLLGLGVEVISVSALGQRL